MDVARSEQLPYGRYLPAPLTGKIKGSKILMVLRVKPTPTRFPTNSLYTPMDNTPLHFFIKCVPPMGHFAVVWSAELGTSKPNSASQH